MDNIELLKHALVYVKNLDKNKSNSNNGICPLVAYYIKSKLEPHVNYNDILYEIRNEMNRLFHDWPKFSGCVRYPVPSPDGGSAESRYWCEHKKYNMWGNAMWTGEYGDLRKELLDFMIIELFMIKRL